MTRAADLVYEPLQLHDDPYPLYRRLRDAIKREFGVSHVRRRLEETVRAEVRQLISGLRGRERVDFAQELALPLPAGVICGWLGFPPGDHRQLVGWFEQMLERAPGQVELPAAALRARDEMRGYVTEAMVARRGRERDDLLSVFVRAHSAGTLSDDEVIGAAMLLFFAGITTTSALIANSLVHLHRFERERELIRRSPELIPAAVEELLRFDAPLQWLTRVNSREVEMLERLFAQSEPTIARLPVRVSWDSGLTLGNDGSAGLS